MFVEIHWNTLTVRFFVVVFYPNSVQPQGRGLHKDWWMLAQRGLICTAKKVSHIWRDQGWTVKDNLNISLGSWLINDQCHLSVWGGLFNEDYPWSLQTWHTFLAISINPLWANINHSWWRPHDDRSISSYVLRTPKTKTSHNVLTFSYKN